MGAKAEYVAEPFDFFELFITIFQILLVFMMNDSSNPLGGGLSSLLSFLGK